MKRITNTVGRWPLAVRIMLAVMAAVAVTLVTPHLAAATVLGHAAPVLTAMIIIPWQPALTRDDLDALANPMFANQPEVVPWQLYDTQSIATGAAGPFVFFQSINVDKTLSNMEGPGQLPDPQYLVVHYVACDFLQAPAVQDGTAVAANVANVENILRTCRATLEFNMSNKRYGPFSLTMTAATGGTTGFGAAEGATAAGSFTMVANNGIPGAGGYPFSGALVIPPKIGFDVTIRLGTAATILSGPINCRISLVGALYRRVL